MRMTNNSFLFVGSYAKLSEPGIAVYSFDEDSGESAFLSHVSGIENPSYFSLSAEGSYLYSISERKEIEARVYAFHFNKKSKQLSMINYQKTDGFSPCYIWIDKNRTMVVTANYRGGNINIFHILEGGELSPVSSVFFYEGHGLNLLRQEKSHPHCIYASPDEKALFVDDLGTDNIYTYNYENEFLQLINYKEGMVNLRPGEGPRHAVFHPNGEFVYLLCELSGNVVVLKYKDRLLRPVQYIGTGHIGAAGGGDIHVSADGNFVYASFRINAEGIAVYKVNRGSGKLSLVNFTYTESHPRNFAISPSGRYLLCACMNSNSIQIFKINNQSGLLTDSHQNIEISRPACLKLHSFDMIKAR